MDSLLRSFYSLAPVNSLKLPNDCSFAAISQCLVANILQDDHFLSYPPSRQYQRRFWKWAIESLEDLGMSVDDDFEIDSRIYDHYLSLMPSSGPATGSSDPGLRSQLCGRGLPMQDLAPSPSYITRFWKQREAGNNQAYEKITLLESLTTIESGTTGMRTWFASFVLAGYLIKHPELIMSKRVLELGSGVGFLGILSASIQVNGEEVSSSPSRPSLWLTDVNEEVLSRCHDNVSLACNTSSRHPDIHFLKLDWSDSQNAEELPAFTTMIHEKINPEIILGADVAYGPSIIPSLVGTLKIALARTENTSRGQKVALIALTVRNESTVGGFFDQVAGNENQL
ncbi:hypothetical protein CPC08DRAFT_681596 [Agrocybe pediades]|nr:hypothetical protein CPC08DRAFT_681596 [Agrocybe pediades]